MKVLGLRDVIARTTVSRPSIYRLEAIGRFPERIQLGPQKVGWIEKEIDDWLLNRPRSEPGLILDEGVISRPVQVLSEPEVIALTTLARSTLARCIHKGLFPAPVKLGERKKGWLKHEVEAWIKTRRRPMTLSSPKVVPLRVLEPA